uniref:Immunoglobulin A1 protease autotransporter n=1 Tax=Lygus hesperus TaxID=30085 RepID=A0A0A9WEE2_LYGHE
MIHVSPSSTLGRMTASDGSLAANHITHPSPQQYAHKNNKSNAAAATVTGSTTSFGMVEKPHIILPYCFNAADAEYDNNDNNSNNYVTCKENSYEQKLQHMWYAPPFARKDYTTIGSQ